MSMLCMCVCIVCITVGCGTAKEDMCCDLAAREYNLGDVNWESNGQEKSRNCFLKWWFVYVVMSHPGIVRNIASLLQVFCLVDSIVRPSVREPARKFANEERKNSTANTT